MILPKLALENYKSAAKARRDKLLRKTPKDAVKIKQNYDRKISECNRNYRAAEAVIDLTLQPRIDAANLKYDQDLRAIRLTEDTEHASCYTYARGLLEYAKQMKQDATYAAEIPKFSQQHAAPIASAPPYEEITGENIQLQDESLRAWFKPPSAPPLEDLVDD